MESFENYSEQVIPGYVATGLPLKKTVLLTIFKDNTETCKKIFHVNDASQLLALCYSEFSHPVRLERFLIYFNDYTDCDTITVVQDYDKFQVHVATEIHLQVIDVQPSQVESAQAECPLPLQSFLKSKVPDIMAEYQRTETCTEGRRKIITLCVGDLVEKHGFYPSTADKLNLAKSLVSVFPSLNVTIYGKNEGYEHLYDPLSHKGFIEMKLRNMKRHLEDGQRRYQQKRKLHCRTLPVTLPTVDEDLGEWLTVIKRMKASPENNSAIRTAMEKTFNYRRN